MLIVGQVQDSQLAYMAHNQVKCSMYYSQQQSSYDISGHTEFMSYPIVTLPTRSHSLGKWNLHLQTETQQLDCSTKTLFSWSHIPASLNLHCKTLCAAKCLLKVSANGCNTQSRRMNDNALCWIAYFAVSLNTSIPHTEFLYQILCLYVSLSANQVSDPYILVKSTASLVPCFCCWVISCIPVTSYLSTNQKQVSAHFFVQPSTFWGNQFLCIIFY
jgi:hypothetical protein